MGEQNNRCDIAIEQALTLSPADYTKWLAEHLKGCEVCRTISKAIKLSMKRRP